MYWITYIILHSCPRMPAPVSKYSLKWILSQILLHYGRMTLFRGGVVCELFLPGEAVMGTTLRGGVRDSDWRTSSNRELVDRMESSRCSSKEIGTLAVPANKGEVRYRYMVSWRTSTKLSLEGMEYNGGLEVMVPMEVVGVTTSIMTASSYSSFWNSSPAQWKKPRNGSSSLSMVKCVCLVIALRCRILWVYESDYNK